LKNQGEKYLIDDVNIPGKRINLTPNMELFLENGRDLSIDKVINKKFEKFNKRSVGFKESRNTYWWKLNNIDKYKDTPYLTIGNPHFDNVDLYYRDGKKWKVVKQGDLVPSSEKKLLYRYPIFKLPDTETVFIRISSPGTMAFQALLFDLTDLNQQKTLDLIIDASFFSVLIIMLIYNIFVFYSSKSSKYGFYCLYLFTTLSSQIVIAGWHNYFFDFGRFLSSELFVHMVFAQMVSTFLLTISYLNTKKDMPISNKVLWVKLFFVCILSLLCLNGNVLEMILIHFFQITVKISSVITITILLLAFYRGLKSNWKKYRIAKFYFPAYIFYLVGALMTSMLYTGGLPYNLFFSNVWKIGITIEIVLIALGLADIINSLRKAEQERSEELSLTNESLKSLNKKLENEFYQSKSLNKKIEELNSQLESKVEIQSKEIKDLIDNINTSIFAIGKDFKVTPPVSKYSETIFGEDIVGKKVSEFLFSNIRKGTKEHRDLRTIFSLIFGGDELQFFGIVDNLPEKVTFHDQINHMKKR
ncbi:hypothetical protein OAK75_14070, partial [Bacteriovoracales bacterium]|nr:hypothetical protein [Bacteriovoracales bacterium]